MPFDLDSAHTGPIEFPPRFGDFFDFSELRLNRIIVLGTGGAGKTTLSRQLGKRLQIPVIHLDEIRSRVTEIAEFRVLIAELHSGDEWVSDGNFAEATFDLRLPRATAILWISVPRWLSLWRATIRVFRKSEAHRFRDLLKVYRFVWRFNSINKPRIERCIREHGPDVPIVFSEAELLALLNRSK